MKSLSSQAEPLVKRLLLGALTLAMLGALAGVLMVTPTTEQRELLDQGHRLAWIGGTTIGTPTGLSLPFFHWDLTSGDWRAVHFVGLHALQALPLLAWLDRSAAPLRLARRWATVGAWAYAFFFAAVFAWTMLGHSVIAVAAPGWWWLAAPALLFAVSAATVLWAGGQRHVG